MVKASGTRIGLTVALVVVMCWPVLSQTEPGSKQPAAKKDRAGLLDFALRGVNASGQNFGQCLDDYRRVALDETISRGYFWSNLLALGVSLFLLLVVVHQHKVQARRTVITAEALTQYHNALARAEAQIAEVTRKNHAFMEILAAQPNADGGGQLKDCNNQSARTRLRKDAQRDPLVRSEQGVPHATESSRLSNSSPATKTEDQKTKDATPEVSPAPSASLKSTTQIGCFGSEVDLVTKINSLQQQLNTSQEREKQLRRQLNESELRLQKEQQKNRSLKT